MNSNSLSRYAAPVLRIGIALVFLWFGTQQVQNPAGWTGFVPDFVGGVLPVSLETFVLMNGVFEIVFGLALLAGLFTRVVALVLALHMFGIAFSLGLSAIGVRDFGLSFATLAIFLNGMDWFSLDWKLRRKVELTA